MRLDSTFHRLVYPLTRYIYKHADAVVTYGTHVKKFLASQGVSEERIFVAHHAVDNCLYGREVSAAEVNTLRQRLDIPADDHVVLYLGRLEANKGIGNLIEAFRTLSMDNRVLVIAGEGNERARLRQQARTMELEHKVRFVDYVQPEDTPPYYALASVLVLPSITTPISKELWGLVINEAMNQGCPVVVTDAVGAAAGGLVQHRKNGLIVPEANVSSMALAIDEILRNTALRRDLSLCARETIRNWDNAQMVNGFCQAIEYVSRQPR
jgi:glycosyltransferase involved in cell wall biosynthesis